MGKDGNSQGALARLKDYHVFYEHTNRFTKLSDQYLNETSSIQRQILLGALEVVVRVIDPAEPSSDPLLKEVQEELKAKYPLVFERIKEARRVLKER